MIEQVLDGFKIPDKHDVEIEGSEKHEAISLICFVKVPQEVDGVPPGLLGDQLVHMAH